MTAAMDPLRHCSRVLSGLPRRTQGTCFLWTQQQSWMLSQQPKPTMKPTIKAALLGASLASVASFSILPLIRRPAWAATPGGGEEYKILSLVPYHEVIGRMEQDLNRLANEGWRVRTGVGTGLILAREN